MLKALAHARIRRNGKVNPGALPCGALFSRHRPRPRYTHRAMAAEQPASIAASPAAGQRVSHEGQTFTTVREGQAYILVPPNARTSIDPKSKAKAGEHRLDAAPVFSFFVWRSPFNMADARVQKVVPNRRKTSSITPFSNSIAT